jgi:hypothetical protein
MRVSLGRGDARVTEKLLDCSQIGYRPGFSLLRRRHDTATIDALEGSRE